MRDIVFLAADLEMKAAIEGFFSREALHLSLNIRPVAFDPGKDMLYDAAGKDSGVYSRAHELLRSYRLTHRRAVVMLDNAWAGSPGKAAIRAHIAENMIRTGWDRDRFAAIVIDPELEIWMWQDNPNVEKAFGYNGPPSLRMHLQDMSLWPENAAKPTDPKEAATYALKICKKRIPSIVFKNIASSVSFLNCTDAAFAELRAALCQWFPPST